jgi:two-component system, response regulator
MTTEIILIEDDEADLELTLHALRENKLANNIRVLRDGEEALDHLFGSGCEELSSRTITGILIAWEETPLNAIPVAVPAVLS